MLDRIVKFFMTRVGELLVDHVHENIKDLLFTFDSLKRNLAILSTKASGIDNQIQNAEISGKMKRKREVEEWLTAVKSIETEFSELENEVESQGFIRRFLGGGRAARLNESVDGLIQQSRHFGERMLDVCETMGEELLTTKLIGKTFAENLEGIWRLLSVEKVPSLGIHGMGGVGKTTLAKHINNRLLEQSEERVIWVTVSQAFTIRKLQDDIARVVHVDLSDEENEDKRSARLWRALSRRKNILLLDDVWEYINLEKVGYPLSQEGFRLIITTRSSVVCRQISCKEVVEVKTLPDDEAWNLFSENLGNEARLTPQVEEIAKCLAKMCGGLPLGIIVLARSMRGETTIHVWRNAFEEFKEYNVMGQEEVFKVLKYSFDRLNPNNRGRGHNGNEYNRVQLCFLHCSLYPEDFRIPNAHLVKNFISGGLMDEKIGLRKRFDQGHCIVDKLVNVSLLESDAVWGVKMHDLVRSMALKITEGTTMVIAGQRSLKEIPNEEEWTKDLAKVSLMRNGIEQIPSGMSPNCPNLSTLFLCHNPLTFLSDSFFSKLHGLCTLDLSETWIEKLPDSLSVLERLEVLLLRSCYRLVYLPYLGNLKALRELNLWETAIQELPSAIDDLIHIERFSVDSPYLEMFPSGLLLRFPNLRRLGFPTILEAPMGEIKKLKQLEYFAGRVKNICDLNQFIRSRVHDTVYFINVGADQFKYYCHPVVLGNYDHQVRLHKYNLKNREEKDEAVSGHDLEAVVISSCEGLSHVLLDDFQRLIDDTKCLKMLKVFECGGTECILKESQSQPFSALERMELQNLWDLQGIIITEKGETVASAPSRQPLFSSLTKLVIRQCHKMKNLGLPVSEFPILEELTVSDCSEIEELMEVGRGDGEARFVYLPRLRELFLDGLPRLKSICSNATVICGSIESITLLNCPEIKKFPLDPPPPSLREISMYEEVWASLEREDPSSFLLLQPFRRPLRQECLMAVGLL